MQVVIDIPEEQIKKSLEESKNIHEDEGEKGSVHIVMLYTNGQLDFVDVSRKTNFYPCKYKVLPKGHGKLIDGAELTKEIRSYISDTSNLHYDDLEEAGAYNSAYYNCLDEIEGAQPIIEADEEV